ncbi:MAG: carboxypeptidase regulatory-like domain-containing protein [Planctomycetes bacterium]|nr:carboxypeptidase regulatory-like domain-containing protein [Planctomycetota bacterium]
MKKLGYVLPLGTLVVLLLTFLVTRWTSARPVPMPIVGAADANLPRLVFPSRDGRITSRVTSAKGDPIARATLWLRVGNEVWFTESAADGAFVFDHVQSGARMLGVVADGFAPQRFEFADDAPIDALVLDSPLAAPPSLPAMKRSTLRGSVNAGGARAAGMQVCLAPKDPPETLGAPLPVRAECGEDGAFAFADLIEGDYTVQVLPRWAANGSWPDLLRPLAGAAARPLRHEEGAHPDGLALAPISATVHGRLRDAHDSPLEGALVLVSPANDPERFWPPTTSGADGAFECADLPPGKYVVRARAGGDSAQMEVELAAAEARELAFRPLDVARAK